MNNQEQTKPQKRHRTQLMVALVVLLVGVACIVSYHPRFFLFYSNVSPAGGNVFGEVFKSSGGVFLVRLNSGSQLMVQANPPKVFLSPKSGPSGFRVCNYLVVPAASLGGVDLSASEGFDKQVPVIGDGKITLKDPMQRGGEFSFPSDD